MMSDKAEDESSVARYCPYCRAKLTKPNDCDACGREFLRANALIETQVQNWGTRGTGPAVQIATTRYVIVVSIMAVSLFSLVFSMLNPVLWMVATCAVCAFGALAADMSAEGMEKKYGRIAAEPLLRFKKGLVWAMALFAVPLLAFLVMLAFE